MPHISALFANLSPRCPAGGQPDRDPTAMRPACRAAGVRLGLPAILAVALLVGIAGSARGAAEPNSADSDGAGQGQPANGPTEARTEADLLSNTRQLTFDGRRSGEGYFSRDGTQFVFQSEREPGNPFFQIYLMDLETGDIRRVSPGTGKTTCGWIHPSGDRVLFASSHEDPQAEEKQQQELQRRASGTTRRYSWDYDENYDIFQFDLNTRELQNLTSVKGYDAEGSWSPDGGSVAFASNRRAYAEPLTDKERELFERDKAALMDIYIMDADGSNVRRLTTALGYDGGPFFSPGGKRICWRRFSEDGARAEIWTMNVDGSDSRQITHLEALSWAPFYHPSGKYLLFSTNLLGFNNFELYMVDVDGASDPVRVTFTPGFDGLPSFSPDGRQLAWTSNRTSSGQSQIFLADWNHERALELLTGSRTQPVADAAPPSDAEKDAHSAGHRSADDATSQFAPQDVLRHVDYLCRPELAGRLTGSVGEKLATAYVAAFLAQLGLEPAGDNGSWFQEFDFTSGVAMGQDNALQWNDTSYVVGQQWQPLAFSRTGKVPAAPVTFAGYGIKAPEGDGVEPYDSFVHLDVTDRWVLVFRFLPEEIAAQRRQHLSRYASLRRKAMLARDLGAQGLIVVSGPNSGVNKQLVPLRFDGSLAGSSIPVISVTDGVARQWLATEGKDLDALQDRLDAGETIPGIALPQVRLSASVDIEKVQRRGRNVLGRLPSDDASTSEQVVVVGAHIDHLGRGASGASLARDAEKGAIHPGADDNASGVAAMLEIAHYLSNLKSQGKLDSRRDILFAGWSGEEMGLLGSSHFVKNYRTESSSAPHSDTVYPDIAAYLNMDMVGRLDKNLLLQGAGSSPIWAREIERRNAPVGLPIKLQNDSYLPTDASAFYLRGVPILSAFTGSHEDYHTPRDTPEKLNYEGATRIARLMALVARSLAVRDAPPDYVAQKAPEESARRANLRAYLGTIPDYAESDTPGVKLSGVSKGGPAHTAGIRAGDVVIELAGRKIENIYDYTYAIEALKVGRTVQVVVQRDGNRLEMDITPGSRH